MVWDFGDEAVSTFKVGNVDLELAASPEEIRTAVQRSLPGGASGKVILRNENGDILEPGGSPQAGTTYMVIPYGHGG